MASRLYVANSGLFEYKTIPGADNDDRLHSGLHFPPFGYPSPAARNGATVEGRQIPGLGDANNARGSSLWTYDVSHPGKTHVASLRLGTPIASANDHVIGGAAPSALAANEHAVYIALAHEDAVAVVDADGRGLRDGNSTQPFCRAGVSRIARDSLARCDAERARAHRQPSICNRSRHQCAGGNRHWPGIGCSDICPWDGALPPYWLLRMAA